MKIGRTKVCNWMLEDDDAFVVAVFAFLDQFKDLNTTSIDCLVFSTSDQMVLQCTDPINENVSSAPVLGMKLDWQVWFDRDMSVVVKRGDKGERRYSLLDEDSTAQAREYLWNLIDETDRQYTYATMG